MPAHIPAPARTGRCGGLADTAQRALERVASGETDTIEGWLAYGAALNEGRGLFPGDLEFGRWLAKNVLPQVGGASFHDDERAAAMWAAANQDDFDTARVAGNARTHGPPGPIQAAVVASLHPRGVGAVKPRCAAVWRRVASVRHRFGQWGPVGCPVI